MPTHAAWSNIHMAERRGTSAAKGSRPTRAGDGDWLWVAAHDDDRRAFHRAISELTPDLVALAHGIVAPAQVDHLIADTWCRAWSRRHSYPGDGEARLWLLGNMIAVAGRSPPQRAWVGHADDQLACLDSAADLETFVRAEPVDDDLARLDPGDALVIRRRLLGGQGWAGLARELGYPSRVSAWKAYRQAIRRLAAVGLHRRSPRKRPPREGSE